MTQSPSAMLAIFVEPDPIGVVQKYKAYKRDQYRWENRDST